jgi:peptidoglycan hydrolase-like protein with peptidoglycan-binding domain
MYDTELVRTVQRSLNDRGFDAGPVDGQWGPNTEAAVREFQQANGIAQTGNLDPRTINALGVAR